MNQHSNCQIAVICFSALSLWLSTGCTHTRIAKFDNPPLGTGTPPIQARVGLVVPRSVVEFHHTYNMMGDQWDYSLGAALQQYIRHVTKSAFKEVKEYSSASEAANHGDAIVVVDSPKAENTLAVFAWENREFVLRINWAVNNRTGQSPIWLKTIEGKAQNPIGNIFTSASNDRKLMSDLLTDLSRNTWYALTNAPELRTLQ